MPSFRVETPQRAYDAIVERGSLARVGEFLPPGAGMVSTIVATAGSQPSRGGTSNELTAGVRPGSVATIVHFPSVSGA